MNKGLDFGNGFIVVGFLEEKQVNFADKNH